MPESPSESSSEKRGVKGRDFLGPEVEGEEEELVDEDMVVVVGAIVCECCVGKKKKFKKIW